MCEICNKYPCNYKCPNYIPPKAKIRCFICEEGIYNGEEYIQNDIGDYAHWECINFGRDLINFLGYEIKEMDEGL